MDAIESTEPAAPSANTAEPDAPGSSAHLFLEDPLGDDDRSSSLSEIGDVSDSEPFGDEPLRLQENNTLAEADSEAETERLEESPNHPRNLRNINLTSITRFENSPSKLAQSTTYDEIDEDDDHEMDETPSKARQLAKGNGIVDADDDEGAGVEDEEEEEEEGEEEDTAADSSAKQLQSDAVGKKRKRLLSTEDVETEYGDSEPLRKRRASLKDEHGDEASAETPLSREGSEDTSKRGIASKDTTGEEAQDLDVPAVSTRGKRGKKGKRKGRKVKEVDEDVENGDGAEVTEDNIQEDEDNVEAAEEVDETDTAAKNEEEIAKKIAAIDALGVLEREFAALRDKIYDEKIAKVDRELEQLTSPEPTHAELLRQLECVGRYRDKKIKYEQTLFRYRVQSLLSRSLADRAQAFSTYFQRVRDTREKHSTAVSKQFYAIQHDRFKTEELGADHYIPFPTRRSQQIAQQTAYNQEVSIMAGVAKYVGFPAAPTLAAARGNEMDEDLEKMGISVEHRPPIAAGTGPLRGQFTSGIPRHTVAEEGFQTSSPWANHTAQANKNYVANVNSFTTPAAQKRVVDIHAPNGSASTIADNASAANSSTANTPYGLEAENRPFGAGPYSTTEYDASGRKGGFRSQSSSPLDVRKSQTNQNHLVDHSRHDVGQHTSFSPPARFGLFGASKQDSSPPLSNRPLGGIHSSASLVTGSGSSRMIAR